MRLDTADSIRTRQYEEIKAAFPELPATCLHRATTFLQSFPNDLGALIYAGMSLSRMARYAEAKSLLIRALSFCPDERKNVVYIELGSLHRSSFEADEAEAWFRKALLIRPNDAGTHVFLGALLALRGRLDEAEACHREALSCTDGAIDEAHLNLALVLRAKQQYAEARTHARAALRLDPAYQAARELLADLRHFLPEEDEA